MSLQGINSRKARNVKLDSGRMGPKLAVRSAIVQGMGGLSVLDCCAGAGVIWDEMRKRWPVVSYAAIDVKPRRAGTVRVDSVDVLRQWRIDQFNVIDVDTYGEPWAHWSVLAPRIKGGVAVFLTHGHVGGPMELSKHARRVMGIPFGWDLPNDGKIWPLVARYCLAAPAVGLVVEKGVVWHGARVSYYGLRVRPKVVPVTGKTGKGSAQTAKRKGRPGPRSQDG